MHLEDPVFASSRRAELSALIEPDMDCLAWPLGKLKLDFGLIYSCAGYLALGEFSGPERSRPVQDSGRRVLVDDEVEVGVFGPRVGACWVYVVEGACIVTVTMVVPVVVMSLRTLVGVILVAMRCSSCCCKCDYERFPQHLLLLI